MLVACSDLCFTHLDLNDAMRAMREMHFAKADLAIHETGPHLKPSEVHRDVNRVASRLRAENLPLAAFHFAPADPFGPEGRDHLRSVGRLARVLSVPVLTVAAAPAGGDMDAEVSRLTDWCKLAAAEGVILTIETHGETLTARPEVAQELCARVPGLGITLDPSHYVSGPHAGANYDALFKYVRHVRLRDSGKKPGEFQVRIGQGQLDYGRILTKLEQNHYDRTLTVDFRNRADSPFPVEPEVRKLKYLLESQV
jgi:sugar phosphate isomerase/epimerase